VVIPESMCDVIISPCVHMLRLITSIICN
jgi:hypothetical protein